MKFTLISLALLGMTLLWLSCKHTKYMADKLPEKQIRWGSGGGFVGKETSFILCDNGQIFGRDMVGNISESGKTSAKKAKALFKTAAGLGLAKMDFMHPGNLYSFLEFQEGDMVNRISWGDNNFPVGKPVEDLYAKLNGLLKK